MDVITRSRWAWRAVGVGLLLALAVAGCSGPTGTKAATAGASTTTARPTAPAASSTVASSSTTGASAEDPTVGPGSGASTTVALTPAFTAPPPAGATTVPVPGTTSAPVAVPTLRILSPKSGDVVAAPVPVQYAVSNFDVGPGRGALQLTLGDGGPFGVSLGLEGPSGVVYLDDNRLSGNRTLVFTLITADARPLTNPEATVRIANVTLEGRK